MSTIDLCRGLYGYIAVDLLEGDVQGFAAPATNEPTIDGGVWSGGGGTLLATDLDLSRTNRDTGAALPAEDGFVSEPSNFNSYNGIGSVELPDGILTLENDGDELTIGVRVWVNGGGVPADQPSGNALAKPMQLFGLGGQYEANPLSEVGTYVQIDDPTADPFSITITQASVPDGLALGRGGSASSVGITTVGDAGSVNNGCVLGVNCPGDGEPEPPDTEGVIAVVMTAKREGPIARCKLYLNGTRIPGDIELDQSLFARRVTFGDIVESDGVWSHGALWCRALSDLEVSALGLVFEQLATCSGKTPGGTFPLIDDAGNSLLNPRFVVPLEVRHSELVSSGVRRETRLADEHRPRAYRLEWEHDNGEDLDRIVGLIESTGGGCLAVRWRHPVDDEPGTPDTAPRWVITNLGELEGLAVTRKTGGHVAGFRLDIEEIR